jgi:outer membrane protein assembly factor BamB
MISDLDGNTFKSLESIPCREGTLFLSGTRKLKLVPEGGGTFAKAEVKVEKGATLTDTAAPFVMEWNTIQSEDGDIRLIAEGTIDEGKDPVSKSVVVCVDNQPPKLKVDSPKDDTTLYKEDVTLEISADAQDEHGIAHIGVSLTVEDAPPLVLESCGEPGNASVTCHLDPTQLGKTFTPKEEVDGTLSVIAEDKAGNTAEVTKHVFVTTRLQWRFDPDERELDECTMPYGPAALSGGRVALAINFTEPISGKIVVFDANGEEVCSWDPPARANGEAPEGITSPLVASKDGSRVVFTTDSHVVSLTPTKAKVCPLTWSALPDGKGIYEFSRPALDDNQKIIYVVDQGKKTTRTSLRTFNMDTGAPLNWAKEISSLTDEYSYSSPALSFDGAFIFIGNEEGDLYKLKYNEPQVPSGWPYRTGGAVESAPLVLDKKVYVAGRDLYLHALNDDGSKIASFNCKNAASFSTDIALSLDGKRLYAGDSYGYLSAIDSATGDILAQYNVGKMQGVPEEGEAADKFKPYTSPVADGNGLVYAACAFPFRGDKQSEQNPCRFNALSQDKLELLWAFDSEGLGKNLFLASPAVSGDRVYIGNTRGQLFALKTTPLSK